MPCRGNTSVFRGGRLTALEVLAPFLVRSFKNLWASKVRYLSVKDINPNVSPITRSQFQYHKDDLIVISVEGVEQILQWCNEDLSQHTSWLLSTKCYICLTVTSVPLGFNFGPGYPLGIPTATSRTISMVYESLLQQPQKDVSIVEHF